ncbi:Hypothetical predicted protein [Pelobates cultripes]|uniref:Secreted protein n=1 Tax=Pelobates cultripes TaxID=61616 RepID=A0AAD1T9M6_PELCU|nr:Hypothetical predicted protein [Pelobates cultripes]
MSIAACLMVCVLFERSPVQILPYGCPPSLPARHVSGSALVTMEAAMLRKSFPILSSMVVPELWMSVPSWDFRPWRTCQAGTAIIRPRDRSVAPVASCDVWTVGPEQWAKPTHYCEPGR